MLEVCAIQEQVEQSLAAGDLPSLAEMVEQRQAVEKRLEQVTETLLGDETLTPRWIGHTAADAETGAIACVECGNNILAGETRCAYCGWTYLAEPSNGA